MRTTCSTAEISSECNLRQEPRHLPPVSRVSGRVSGVPCCIPTTVLVKSEWLLKCWSAFQGHGTQRGTFGYMSWGRA